MSPEWVALDGFLARVEQELRFHEQLMRESLPFLPLPEEAA